MKKYQKAFLSLCAKAIFHSSKVIPEPAGREEWNALFRFSAQQNILPLVTDALIGAGLGKAPDPADLKKAKGQAVGSAIRQIRQTNEILTLLLHAQEKGLDPVVMKGIVCRSLYPVPCLRPSVDEDLLILPGDTEKYHLFLLSEGFMPDREGLSAEERAAAAELSYHREGSPSCIELHKYLFDPDSEIFGRFNKFFAGLPDRTVRVQVEDVGVRAPAPTDHVLYLILHAYKHFLHSGIGIRPLCDIGLYAETYAPQIDWEAVREDLESVHAFYFTRALLRILQIHLLPDGELFSYIRDWDLPEVDVEALLADCMESGVHGASSLSRLHSSRMTLHAAEDREGSGRGRYVHAVLRSALPPARKMEDRYTYLKRSPILLPVAWVQRAAHYLAETGKKESEFEADNSAAESIRLGRERIGLLRQYKIIE